MFVDEGGTFCFWFGESGDHILVRDPHNTVWTRGQCSRVGVEEVVSEGMLRVQVLMHSVGTILISLNTEASLRPDLRNARLRKSTVPGRLPGVIGGQRQL